MKYGYRTIVASAVAATTIAGMPVAPALTSASHALVRSDEISAYRRAAPVARTRPYRGFADPSFGPDGKPYPVPPYLRNQCYIDMGYGRFQACTIR